MQNSHFYWNDDEMLNCWVVEGKRWDICVEPLEGFLWGHLGWHNIYVGTYTHSFIHLHTTVTYHSYIQVHLHLHSHYIAFTLHYITYTSTFTSIFTLAFTLAHVIVCLCVCLCLCVCVSVCFCVFLSVPEGRCSDSPSVRKSVCLF